MFEYKVSCSTLKKILKPDISLVTNIVEKILTFKEIFFFPLRRIYKEYKIRKQRRDRDTDTNRHAFYVIRLSKSPTGSLKCEGCPIDQDLCFSCNVYILERKRKCLWDGQKVLMK